MSYTWYNKSLDIPGVKRGLVANTLLPSEYILTNDPVVLRNNLFKGSSGLKGADCPLG
jgi:hypothetical protein